MDLKSFTAKFSTAGVHLSTFPVPLCSRSLSSSRGTSSAPHEAELVQGSLVALARPSDAAPGLSLSWSSSASPELPLKPNPGKKGWQGAHACLGDMQMQHDFLFIYRASDCTLPKSSDSSFPNPRTNNSKISLQRGDRLCSVL